MAAYYNEIDPYAAQWLRNLIVAGVIAPGDVDERSISDVRPDDLKPYRQCHFFAGIGIWSAALRRIGWPDDARIWTGSCPCQPFSSAGARAGVDDERHLWPDFHYLISLGEAPLVVGEQVASKDVNAWIDHVQADMEGLGFAFGALAFPAAGIGAPHIRDRCYWLADADGWNAGAERKQRGGQYGQFTQDDDALRLGSPSRTRLQGSVGHAGIPGEASGTNARQAIERTGIYPGGLADASSAGHERRRSSKARNGRDSTRLESERLRDAFRLADAPVGRFGEFGGALGPGDFRHVDGGGGGSLGAGTGPANGLWRDADWLLCTDGKWRPVEGGTFPLAHGDTARVGRLRAYGNAINLSQAVEFLDAAGLRTERNLT